MSDIELDIEFYRIDNHLFTVNPDEIYYEIPKIQQKHHEFFDIYNNQIIGVGMPEQKDYYSNLSEFFFYCDMMNLHAEVMNKFPLDDEFLNTSITEAFKHYIYYFPEKSVPKIIFCISGFNLSIFIGNDFIGVSLDMYLGENFTEYNDMFDRYLSRRMHKKMIPVDISKALYIAEFPYNDSINNVLTNSIYEGRIQYFLDAMLPYTPDTLKWGYTQMQWGWANMYEKNIWDFMVAEKKVFSNSSIDIKIFTGEAPFTTPFKNNSAPRAGAFVGYKIVQAYMKNNSEITLQELMYERDYMKIYNNSYYRPK